MYKRQHVPWYAPQKYFDLFPLDEIQLPSHLKGDLDDVPASGQKMAKRHWHKWIIDNDQWKKAVQAYLASLSFADDMVGELLDALDNSPIAKDTLVVFWGDHGYHLGEKENWEKFALWEDTTHVPLIIVDPRRTQPGTRCESPVSLLDLYPTLVELCGLEPPPQTLEGQSLAKRLAKPRAKTRRVAVTTQGKANHAVRSGRYRYIRYADGSEELYDHKTDPPEWRNLASDSSLARVKSRLAKRLPAVNVDPIQIKPRP